MPLTLDDATEARLLRLHPFVRSRPPEQQAALALATLLDAEACRRGAPDPVSGALHVFFLTQGELLRPEYDLSVHAHAPWEVGLLTADVRGMIHVNQAAGFAAGDRFLRAVAAALAAAFPRAHVVRIHTDCFLCLFPPSAEARLDDSLRQLARARLAEAEAGFRSTEPKLETPVDFTLGLGRLRIVDPSHWQVLGPLVWAEAERIHALTRTGKLEAVHEHTLDLAGRVEIEPSDRGATARRG
ncbi:MAG TPA: diguanylate cyclase [Myxococcaceae bacterium]|nr:diguanylate cyclase [Myxococcaceae bacterium]